MIQSTWQLALQNLTRKTPEYGTHECIYCNKRVTPSLGQEHRAKFCSDKCKGRHFTDAKRQARADAGIKPRQRGRKSKDTQ